jgi:hypothetical protein
MAANLVQLVVEKTGALRLLEEACDAHIGTDGGRDVVLDAAMETAKANGYSGSFELAFGVLRLSRRFVVEKGSAGKWIAIRRSTAMVPAVAGRSSTALALVATGPRPTDLVPLSMGQ